MRVSTVLFIGSAIGALTIVGDAFLFTAVYNQPIAGMFVCNMLGVITGCLFGNAIMARQRGD